MPPTLRINRYVLLAIGIIAGGYVLYMLKGALFPFIIGGMLAYILYPVVTRLEHLMPWRKRRPGLSRVTAILMVYVAAIGLVVGVLIVVIPPAFQQSKEFIDSFPDFFERARTTIEGWNEQYASRIPEDIRLQIEERFQDAGSILAAAGQNVLSRTLGAVSHALTIVLGLAAVPVFLYYLLKDRESLLKSTVSIFPPNAREHARNVITIVNDVFAAYVKAQLFLGLVVGVMVFLGLFFLGIRFAVLLGVLAGLFELMPIIGPWLGAIPGILVTLATSPEDIVWVILLYLGIQLFENLLLLPRVQSHALKVHPIVIIMVIVIGSEVAGLWGVVLGPPLAAAVKGVFTYFSQMWSEQDLHSEEEASAVEPLSAEALEIDAALAEARASESQPALAEPESSDNEPAHTA